MWGRAVSKHHFSFHRWQDKIRSDSKWTLFRQHFEKEFRVNFNAINSRKCFTLTHLLLLPCMRSHPKRRSLLLYFHAIKINARGGGRGNNSDWFKEILSICEKTRLERHPLKAHRSNGSPFPSAAVTALRHIGWSFPKPIHRTCPETIQFIILSLCFTDYVCATDGTKEKRSRKVKGLPNIRLELRTARITLKTQLRMSWAVL